MEPTQLCLEEKLFGLLLIIAQRFGSLSWALFRIPAPITKLDVTTTHWKIDYNNTDSDLLRGWEL